MTSKGFQEGPIGRRSLMGGLVSLLLLGSSFEEPKHRCLFTEGIGIIISLASDNDRQAFLKYLKLVNCKKYGIDTNRR